jgi:hypothetical protein
MRTASPTSRIRTTDAPHAKRHTQHDVPSCSHLGYTDNAVHPSCEALEPPHAALTMVTAVHQQTGKLPSAASILTYPGEAGSRSRPDRQGFHVFCTAAPAGLRQVRRTGSTELALLRGSATSNCSSARKRIVGREDVDKRFRPGFPNLD